MKVGVVGAGIVGRLLAWQLLQTGWQVNIFDENHIQQKNNCSYVAAGLLSPYSELSKSCFLINKMGKQSIALWKKIIASLNPTIYFQTKGSIVLAHQRDQPCLENQIKLIKNQLPNDQIQNLSAEKLIQLEPELSSHSFSAYYFPLEAQIDSQEIMTQLQNCFLKKGGQWQSDTKIVAIHPGTIKTSKKIYRFDLVVDCRGLAARRINGENLRGIRGEMIKLHAPEVNLSRPIRLMHPRYPLYLVPRPNHIYLVGASEIENEDYTPLSVRTCLELLTAVYSVHPGFAEARIMDLLVHCRPAFPNNLPGIFVENGKIAINGLYRHGFLLAPFLIALIVDYLKNQYFPEEYASLIKISQ